MSIEPGEVTASGTGGQGRAAYRLVDLLCRDGLGFLVKSGWLFGYLMWLPWQLALQCPRRIFQ